MENNKKNVMILKDYEKLFIILFVQSNVNTFHCIFDYITNIIFFGAFLE